jgi:hypothetical protein
VHPWAYNRCLEWGAALSFTKLVLGCAALHKPPPWKTGMNECREEAEMVMFTSVRRVLEQTGLKPKQVGSRCACGVSGAS